MTQGEGKKNDVRINNGKWLYQKGIEKTIRK